MVSAKSAIENFVIDRMDYGTVKIRPMMTGHRNVEGQLVVEDQIVEERDGWAVVEAHSNTGSRYLVTATPVGSAVALKEGGDIVVALLTPWNTSYVMNPFYLTCSFVSEKFAHPMYRW